MVKVNPVSWGHLDKLKCLMHFLLLYFFVYFVEKIYVRICNVCDCQAPGEGRDHDGTPGFSRETEEHIRARPGCQVSGVRCQVSGVQEPDEDAPLL